MNCYIMKGRSKERGTEEASDEGEEEEAEGKVASDDGEEASDEGEEAEEEEKRRTLLALALSFLHVINIHTVAGEGRERRQGREEEIDAAWTSGTA